MTADNVAITEREHHGNAGEPDSAPARRTIMKRTLAAAVTAAVISVAAAACGSPAPSPAAPSIPAAEQSAITAMAAHCTQSAAQLAAMIAATHGLEVKAGVTDESAAALAGHLATVVAAYGSRKVSCVSPFAAYVTMREGG